MVDGASIFLAAKLEKCKGCRLKKYTERKMEREFLAKKLETIKKNNKKEGVMENGNRIL